MVDEKDRLGEKLRDLEHGREDHFFAEQDRKLLEKLKQQREEEASSGVRQAAIGHCPKCGTALQLRVMHEVTVDECPSCRGLWFDCGELDELARREKEGWFGRLFRSRFG